MPCSRNQEAHHTPIEETACVVAMANPLRRASNQAVVAGTQGAGVGILNHLIKRDHA
jgi:hypothetical protein